MTDGPDVRQLQAGLIAGHFAGGLFTTATGHYDLATADAVERWQAARGLTVTGLIPLGQVVFLPTAILVGAMNVAAGEAAGEPAQRPYQVTTGQRTVTVPLNPEPAAEPPSARASRSSCRPRPPCPGSHRGGSVLDGGVLDVGPAHGDAFGCHRHRGERPGAGVPGGPVRPRRAGRPGLGPARAGGGGYGLEVVTPSGAHRLVGVAAGLFASGQVQVSGPGITAGTRVAVAQ